MTFISWTQALDCGRMGVQLTWCTLLKQSFLAFLSESWYCVIGYRKLEFVQRELRHYPQRGRLYMYTTFDRLARMVVLKVSLLSLLNSAASLSSVMLDSNEAHIKLGILFL